MKKTIGSLIVFALALGTLGTVAISNALAEAQVYSIDQLPAAVRTAIEQHAGQQPIAKIKRETEEGVVVYEIEQQVNGQEVEFQVSASGEYLGPEAEDADDDDDGEGAAEDQAEQAVTWDQLPKSVQDGLTAVLGATVPEKLTREVEDGFTTYEAEFETNGTEYSVKLSDTGDTLETEEKIATSSLPDGVVQRLAQIGPNAEVHEVQQVTVTFYEVELKSKGRTHEIRMLANGQRLDDED